MVETNLAQCNGVAGAKIISANVSGIAEGRDLEHESFTIAQMPNRNTKD